MITLVIGEKMRILDNFFTSGWEILDNFEDIKSQYQMLNIGLLLSSFGLMFGITSNLISGNFHLIYVEVILIFMNITMFFTLRKKRKYVEYVRTLLTAQFTILFLFLMYSSEPSAMKHVWLFTYPIIILYNSGTKKALTWLSFLLFMIFIAPLQPFVDVQYTLHQTVYILFVVVVVSSIMYFYKVKIDEAKKLILKQQNELLDFNAKLANEVELKTAELRDINESLEITVEEKIEELIQKDKLLTVQSKQAVMGEMITMIAHQWRQPLSTITLQISNYQIEQLLNQNSQVRAIDKTLEEISNTIMYLSDTVDDFQTYFHPDKEVHDINIDELLNKTVSFALPRLKKQDIKITVLEHPPLEIRIYMNELIQVILNLLNNAIDALLDLEQKGSKIDISVQEKGERVLITVSDNADGISEENIHRVFEPYFSTKGKNGTGLGLYMSQMIVEKQFNGELRVESTSKGSAFIVEIPKIIS